MYRVKDNGNGSFNVFDSSTGNLVMVITNNNNKENGRLKRVTTLPQSKQSTQLLTPLNGYRLGQLKGNGFSPSVSLPIITVCGDKSKRYSRRNLRNKNIAKVEGGVVDSLVMASKRKRNMAADYYYDDDDYDDDDNDDDFDCIDQDTFMNFFGLASTKEPVPSVVSLQKFKKRLNVTSPTYTRNHVCDVDLCSNLGLSMVNNSQAVYAVSETEKPSSMVAKYEKYCQASSRRLGNWDVPFRQANMNYAVTYSPKMQWSCTHLYSFNQKQRLQRYKRIKTGLTKRSRFLLRLCKNVTINLKRVSNEEITSKCLMPLDSIVENTTPITTTSPATNSPFGSKSPNTNICEYPCIDGTIVIEIDEVGSETVRVSQKPSKMINQQTGNPWLSPHSLSTIGSRFQSYQRAKRCLVTLDDVQKSPLRFHSSSLSSPRLSTDRTNGDNNGSDSDSDIEIIGIVSTSEAAKPLKKSHVVRNLLNGLSDNKDSQLSDANISINPLEFVATSYDAASAGFRGNSTSVKSSTPFKQEQRETVICLNKISPSRKMSVTRRAGRIDEATQSRLQSSLELENGDNDVNEVCPSNIKRPNTRQIELDMISRLVFLGRSTAATSDSPITRRASARNGDVSCVFKCHVCKCEELFKRNAVDSVYCHMVKHGGLSCTSLVSNLEEFEGYEVAILQAFPIAE